MPTASRPRRIAGLALILLVAVGLGSGSRPAVASTVRPAVRAAAPTGAAEHERVVHLPGATSGVRRSVPHLPTALEGVTSVIAVLVLVLAAAVAGPSRRAERPWWGGRSWRAPPASFAS